MREFVRKNNIFVHGLFFPSAVAFNENDHPHSYDSPKF